jgi:hypothetical protein
MERAESYFQYTRPLLISLKGNPPSYVYKHDVERGLEHHPYHADESCILAVWHFSDLDGLADDFCTAVTERSTRTNASSLLTEFQNRC